jgi:ABC-type Na+ efflux pump permease subunit
MKLGPIVWRESIVASRRRSTWDNRMTAVGVPLLCVGALEAFARWADWSRASVGEQSQFALGAFGLMVFLATLTAMLQPLKEVAPAIALERDKKSLDALLTTELSSTEIVLGKFLAGMLGYVWGLLAGLPLTVVLTWWWGIDFRLVPLMYAGLAATALAGGSVALAASTRARNPIAANRWTALIVLTWLWMPLPVALTLPRIWPALSHWVSPLAWMVIDTGPTAVFAHLVGIKAKGTLVETVLRMIAWETGISTVILVWTCVRFRALCRAAEDREGRYWLRKLRRRAAFKRPPCGDDGVLWYEKYNTRGQGPLERWINALVFGGLAVLGCLLVIRLVLPPFGELWARGYGAGPGGAEKLEMQPLVRLVLSIKETPPPLADGMIRVDFNAAMRQLSGILTMLYAIVLAGFAAEGISYERTRDTLSGLLTTPLTGLEILRSKALGALWRARWVSYFLVAFWSLGLASGALHPLGYLAALLSLALTIWFCLSVGIYGSLVATSAKDVAGWVTMPVAVMIFSGLVPLMLPSSMTTLFAGFASPAWVSYLSLLSYEDVRDASMSGPYPPLSALGVASGERFAALAATCLAGWTLLGVTAFLLTRASIRDFDRHVGRPTRPAEAVPSFETTPVLEVAYADPST